jgi:XTP/dITP diphosphohydrolase
MNRRPVVVIATRNRGKVREIAALLAHAPIELRALDAFPGAPTVEETGATYYDNAALKAHALARFTQLPALADDSGLEVDALGAAPGIRSARFAGDHAADSDNIALLLDRLRGVPPSQRTARFRAVIVVAHPDGREISAEGTCEGLIAEHPCGIDGFGYDPVFYYPPLARTFAEIDAQTKNRISHRTQALRRIGVLLVESLLQA